MATLLQDLKYGLRMLAKNPGFTAVAAITLALGIGANTAIFSVANAVLLRPLPYSHSDRLVWIAEVIPALNGELAGGGDYVDWKDQSHTLEQITAYDDSARLNLTGRGTPERIHAAQVSASFFATLGVAPQLGRDFTADEDQPNGRNVAILMPAFWQQYFGSDPQVLGRTVTLNAAPYTVVGVMPDSFRFPGGSEVQMLVPLALNEARERLRVRNTLVRIIGRLKPGVSMARARDELDAIRKRAQPAVAQGGPGQGPPSGQRQMMQFTTSGGPPPASGGMATPAHPQGVAGANVHAQGAAQPSSTAHQVPPSGGGPTIVAQRPTGPPMSSAPSGPAMIRAPKGARRSARFGPNGPPEIELKVVPLAEHLAGNLRGPMLVLLAVVGLVLLIACANMANLMLARAAARTREVAVRAILGAGRWRLVRQMLSESVLLALAGGAAGLLLAAWSAEVIAGLIPPSVGAAILSVAPVRVDSRVLLFTLIVSVATGILFGLAPAVAATRPDLAARVKEGSPAATLGPRRGLLRGFLAVAELSMALVLLIGAGLLIKSFYRVLSVDPGFAPERVLTMNLSLTDARYPGAQQKLAFFSEVLRRVESLPGVRSAALADSLPLTPYHIRLMIRTMTSNGPVAGSNATVMMSRLTVSPGYFYTLGIPVIKGRTFTDQDNEQSPKVAVVNETLARHLWPGQDPVGRELPLLGQTVSVIGVVGDTRHESLGQEPESEFYAPYLQETGNSMQLAVRTAQDPASLAPAVRAQIAAIDAELPIYHVATLEQTLSESVAPRRFNMLLLGIFAAIALMLATVGVYGVMAFSVTQRTHEIGIRMALGAEQGKVLRMVIGQGLRLTLLGILLGLAGAWALTRFLAGFLYGVRPTDPATFALVSTALLAVSILASYFPARRATKVDPMVALRYE